MVFQVHTDENYVGMVMSDLTQRRSQINDVQARGDTRTVCATTPLSELRGYSTQLRTFTSGTANFSMELATYQRMTLHEQRNAMQAVTGFMPDY